MSFTAKFHPEALIEFNESADWYESRQVGLGQKYVDEVDAAIKKILSAPKRPECVYRDVRLRSVDGFPYQIYYRVLEPNIVEVISVFHVRQNPAIWQARG